MICCSTATSVLGMQRKLATGFEDKLNTLHASIVMLQKQKRALGACVQLLQTQKTVLLQRAQTAEAKARAAEDKAHAHQALSEAKALADLLDVVMPAAACSPAE